MLFDGSDVAYLFRLALLGHQVFDLGEQVRIVCDQVTHHRMLRSELQRSGTVDGIYTSGEDGDLAACWAGYTVNLEIDQCAFAATDPVALHRTDFFRPAIQRLQIA